MSRRIPASSPASLVAQCEVSNDVDPKATGPASVAPAEFAGTHQARLRRCDVDAVRRLRPRLGDRGACAGVLGTGSATAPRCEDERHRLLVENDGVFHEAIARLQRRAW